MHSNIHNIKLFNFIFVIGDPIRDRDPQIGYYCSNVVILALILKLTSL